MREPVSPAVWVATMLVFAVAVVLPLWIAFDGQSSQPDGLAMSPGIKDGGLATGHHAVRSLPGDAATLFQGAPPLLAVRGFSAVVGAPVGEAVPEPSRRAAKEARLL